MLTKSFLLFLLGRVPVFFFLVGSPFENTRSALSFRFPLLASPEVIVFLRGSRNFPSSLSFFSLRDSDFPHGGHKASLISFCSSEFKRHFPPARPLRLFSFLDLYPFSSEIRCDPISFSFCFKNSLFLSSDSRTPPPPCKYDKRFFFLLLWK